MKKIQTHTLSARIERLDDIEVTVLALEARVPPGCEAFRPPMPTASRIQAAYFGNVRVAMAYTPVEGRYLMRADLYYRQAE